MGLGHCHEEGSHWWVEQGFRLKDLAKSLKLGL